jgi:hypothetical protein
MKCGAMGVDDAEIKGRNIPTNDSPINGDALHETRVDRRVL